MGISVGGSVYEHEGLSTGVTLCELVRIPRLTPAKRDEPTTRAPPSPTHGSREHYARLLAGVASYRDGSGIGRGV